MRPDLIEIQRRRAIEVLRACCHASGLKASGRNHGHHQVWARDAMIALPGALLCGDAVVQRALHASLATLAAHQTPLGAIPNNVDCETGRVNFRAYADGGLWFVIGASLMDAQADAAARALEWYEYQDVDGAGLLSMQEAADWQDLFPVRGKPLGLNCLWVLALRAAADAAARAGHAPRAEALQLRASDVAGRINRHFWYPGSGDLRPHFALTYSTSSQDTDSLGRRRQMPVKRHLVSENYYLPYLSFRAAGEWFDLCGHLLAILSGVADSAQCDVIIDFAKRHRLAQRPATAIYPPILAGEADWRDYFGELNQPHQYHNGGVWPFLGGFWVAALVRAGRMEEARDALERLAALNESGQFNEWHHGISGEPMGVEWQAWSAGTYLYACECVAQGRTPLLPAWNNQGNL